MLDKMPWLAELPDWVNTKGVQVCGGDEPAFLTKLSACCLKRGFFGFNGTLNELLTC